MAVSSQLCQVGSTSKQQVAPYAPVGGRKSDRSSISNKSCSSWLDSTICLYAHWLTAARRETREVRRKSDSTPLLASNNALHADHLPTFASESRSLCSREFAIDIRNVNNPATRLTKKEWVQVENALIPFSYYYEQKDVEGPAGSKDKKRKIGNSRCRSLRNALKVI